MCPGLNANKCVFLEIQCHVALSALMFSVEDQLFSLLLIKGADAHKCLGMRANPGRTLIPPTPCLCLRNE